MARKILAVLVASSLASGCTVLLPTITAGVQGDARDAKVAQRHSDNTVAATVVGVILDAALIAVALDFQNTLEHSGD